MNILKIVYSKLFWFIISVILVVITIGVLIWFWTLPEKSSLFIKNIGSIQQSESNGNTFSTLIEDHVFGITAFDSYPKRTVYYATTKPNSPIISTTEKYPNLTQYTNQWTKTALAVDFVGEKLYVVDNLAQKVYVIDTESKHYSVVLKNLKDPKDIALDPYEGLMFVLQALSILQARMTGTEVKTVVDNSNIKAFTIDRSKTTLYYASSDSIESYDYKQGTRARVMFRASETISLSVIEDRLYVVDVARSNEVFKVLRSCKLLNGVCKKMDELHSDEDMQAVKAFENNPRAMQNPCGRNNGGCEHLCLLTIGESYSCVCNEGWKLNGDGTTCSEMGT